MSVKNAIGGAAEGAGAGAAFGPVGAGIGGVLGGLTGLFSGGDSAETDAREEQKKAFEDLRFLSPEQRAVQLKYLESVGAITPQEAQVFEQQATELNNIAVDPVVKQAQLQALAKLQQVGSEGLTATDVAALNEIHNQTGQQNRGMQGAILQNQASRGMLGSGSELAARLNAAQSATTLANQQGTAQAAQAQARALQGMMASGDLAGKMENAQFSQQAQKANAQDLINKFNTAAKQNVSNYNVNANNAAQEYNLNYKRELAKDKQNIANQQATNNVNAAQGYNQDVNAQKLGAAGVNVNLGQSKDKDAQSAAQGVGNVLTGAAEVANGVFGDKDKKSKFGSLFQ